MTTISDDPPVLQGAENEDITIEIQSAGTTHVVTCVRDAKVVQPKQVSANCSVYKFALRSKEKNPSELRIGYVFSGTQGSYTVTVTGNPGGDTHQKTYKQKFQIPADGKEYQFPIV